MSNIELDFTGKTYKMEIGRQLQYDSTGKPIESGNEYFKLSKPLGNGNSKQLLFNKKTPRDMVQAFAKMKKEKLLRIGGKDFIIDKKYHKMFNKDLIKVDNIEEPYYIISGIRKFPQIIIQGSEISDFCNDLAKFV